MVEPELSEELGDAPVRACGECGHREDEHEVQEAELPGATARRTYCLACAAFHDFVAAPS